MNRPPPIEVECSHLIVSVEHAVQHATSLANKTKLMRTITQLANPYLQVVNERLAALITHEFPDAMGGLLLVNALGDAAQAYSDCAQRGGRLEENEFAYLSALITRAAGMSDYAVHGINGRNSALWTPFCSPLMQWIQDGRYTRLVFSLRPAPANVRHAALVFLCGELLTFERASLIERLLPHANGCVCDVA